MNSLSGYGLEDSMQLPVSVADGSILSERIAYTR